MHTDGGLCVWLGGAARGWCRQQGGSFLDFTERALCGVAVKFSSSLLISLLLNAAFYRSSGDGVGFHAPSYI